MVSHKYLRNSIANGREYRIENKEGCNNVFNKPKRKRKRKRLAPQHRRTRKSVNKMKRYRLSVMECRARSALAKAQFIWDALAASEDLLASLNPSPSNLRLRDDLSKDIREMKARASRYRDMYIVSSVSSTSDTRCKRIRTVNPKTQEKLVRRLVHRRRKDRVSEPLFDSDSSDSELDYDSDSSGVSVDSELEDETYVPEVISRRKRGKRKRKGRRGNNESTFADRDEIFADEVDGYNEKYQFAIDLKGKDKSPGKRTIILIINYIQYEIKSNSLLQHLKINGL